MRPSPICPGAEKNLKRFGIERDAREAGRKGGLASANSVANKVARKLRRLKGKELLIFMMKMARTDDPLMAFEFMNNEFFKQLELIECETDERKKFYMRDRFLERMAQFMKLKFGEKIKSVNINVNTSFDEYVKRVEEFKKVEKEMLEEDDE